MENAIYTCTLVKSQDFAWCVKYMHRHNGDRCTPQLTPYHYYMYLCSSNALEWNPGTKIKDGTKFTGTEIWIPVFSISNQW